MITKQYAACPEGFPLDQTGKPNQSDIRIPATDHKVRHEKLLHQLDHQVGKWYRLNVDKPLFKEDKEMFERKYGSEKQKRYPRTVMKGLYFQNLDAAFENALSEDENTRK